MTTSFGYGSAYLAEVFALEMGLQQAAWDLGYQVVVCFSDCSNVVDVFCFELNVSRF